MQGSGFDNCCLQALKQIYEQRGAGRPQYKIKQGAFEHLFCCLEEKRGGTKA
jgi:hypothetical protein